MPAMRLSADAEYSSGPAAGGSQLPNGFARQVIHPAECFASAAWNAPEEPEGVCRKAGAIGVAEFEERVSCQRRRSTAEALIETELFALER